MLDFTTQNFVLSIILTISLAIALVFASKYYKKDTNLQINEKDDLWKHYKRFRLFFIILGIFFPTSEIIIETFKVRQQSDWIYYVFVGIFCLLIAYFSPKSPFIKYNIHKIFIGFLITLTIFLFSNIINDAASPINMIEFAMFMIFSYNAFYKIKYFYIYIIVVVLVLFGLLLVGQFSAKIFILYFNSCFVSIVFNFAIYLIDINSKKNLFFAYNFINKGQLIVIGINKKGEIKLVSENIKSIAGIDKNDWKGKKWNEVIEDFEDFEEQKNLDEQILIKKHYINQDEYKLIEWRDDPFYKDLNVKIGRDITESKKAETELKKTRKILEETNRITRTGSWEVDLKTGVVNWSEITKEIHEVPLDFVPKLEEAIGYYKDDGGREIIIELYNKLVTEATPYTIELPLITAKGNEVWIKTFGLAEFENGKCKRVFGAVQDISEQVKSKNVLKESEEKLRFITENTTDVLMVIEAGILLYISPVHEKVYGYTIKESIKVGSESVYDFVHPDDRASVKKTFSDAIKNRLSTTNYTFRFLHKDGHYIWREDTVNLFYREGGENGRAILKLIILARDISKKMAIEIANKIDQEKKLLQNNILIGLSTTPYHKSGFFENELKTINEAIVAGTGVSRVSVWEFNRKAIVCRDLFEKETNAHTSGQELQERDYPMYFEGIRSGLAIVAHDAYTNKYTADFAESYLKPLNIKSMLDVSIRMGGDLVGVLCLEHTNEPKIWSDADISFARSIADIISLGMEANKRRIAETKLIENQKQLQYKSEILSAIAKTTENLLVSTEILKTLHDSFELIGVAADVDRVFYFQNDLKTNLLSQQAEWVREPFLAFMNNPGNQNLTFQDFNFYMEPLLQNRIFQQTITEIKDTKLIARWLERDIKSVLILPIFIKDIFYGFIGFDDCTKEQSWTDDQLTILQSLATNISNAIDRINKERIIKESENNFRQIGDTIEDVFWLFDHINDKHIYVSSSCKKVLDVEPQYFYKDNAYGSEYLVETYKNIGQTIQKQLLENNYSEVEYQIKTSSGQIKWIYEKNFGIKNENGVLIRSSGICSDITEKKIIQNQVEQLSLVAEKITNGVVIANIEGQVQWANQAYLDMMEIELTDLLNKRPRDLFRPANSEMIAKIEALNGYNFSIELELETFKNNKKWIEVNNTAIKDEAEKTIQQIEVVIDISNRKIAEKALFTALEEANIANKDKAELELKALQMQMNPHFVFNALNSIQSYIMTQDTISANTYLTKFAQLMRLFLDSSRSKFIALEEEIRLLTLYIELEKLRFDDKFDFEILLEKEGIKHFEIPTMILQPFVENAINHGLRYKKTKGILKIKFFSESGLLICTIEDNGVGRRRSKQIQEKTNKGYQSQGLKITRERLLIYNRINEANIDFTINDVMRDSISHEDEVGTRIEIKFPEN